MAKRLQSIDSEDFAAMMGHMSNRATMMMSMTMRYYPAEEVGFLHS
jgi:hypothetical protein